MTTLQGRKITGPMAWISSRKNSTAASWRTQKPVLNEAKCTGCMICWKYCPEPAIEPSGKKIAFMFDVCKGCGVCAAVCMVKAIDMVPEGL